MAWVADNWQWIVGGATVIGALAAALALFKGGDKMKASKGGVVIKGKGNAVNTPPKDTPK